MTKGRFRVRVIRAGLSLNRNFYPDAALREALPLFEGVRVFVKSDKEHLANGGKDVRNLIGRITSPEFLPSREVNSGEIIGTLELIEADDAIGRKIASAADRGMLGLFGLSIDAEGEAETRRIGGASVRALISLTKVNSVDLIVDPGAGGQVINLIEAAGSIEGNQMDRGQIIAFIQKKAPALLEGRTITALTDEEVMSLLNKAWENETAADPAAAKVTEAVAMINGSRLPTTAKTRLVEAFKLRNSFSMEEVRAAITGEINYLVEAAGAGGGHVSVPGGAITIGDGPKEKGDKMLDAFFNPDDRSVISIRECYREITGDAKFTGRIQTARLTEALDTTAFGIVLGNSIARRMVEEYRVEDIFGVWRDLVSVVPVTDFRMQERTRFGGYGDLPTVAESGPYTELDSPDDEKATYALSKRGGLEKVTLEMIANDDVGAIRRIPLKLAQAAKRTLSRFVFEFLRANPVIYDTKALFHADHGNLGSASLTVASLAAARLAMKAQTEKNSDEKIGIPPKFLWIPDTLEETAYNLFARDTNNDPDFVQQLALKIRQVWCWTDANDWCLSADPRNVPTIELGFFNGQEEPELFVQDDPRSGSHFSNDQMTYKIRHIYGATVEDYRGLYKAIVA